MTAISQKRYTLEEYLKFEWDAPWRHYFIDGVVGSMPYASENKSTITVNTLAELGNAKEEANYHLYLNGRMLFIPAANTVFYPNLMITKGKQIFYQFNKKMNANLNPCALLEVAEDFNFDKWQFYRQISSLRQYFEISQTQIYINIYNRIGNSDKWENSYVNKMEQTIRIAEFDISVAKIYKKITFPEKPESTEGVILSED